MPMGSTLKLLHLGRLLDLPAKIVLGWNCLPRTNNLAYLTHSEITPVKKCVTLASEPNIIKLFVAVIYEF
jgi:hypothetical protein